MRRVIVTIVAVLGLLTAGDFDDDSGIGGIDLITGSDGSGVVVEGTQESGGTPETSPIGDWNDWTPESPIDDGPAPWSPPERLLDDCLSDWDSSINCFDFIKDLTPAPEDEAAEEGSPAMPAVTISDLVRFAPAGSSVMGEPDNVGVAGLPTNFVATASVHTIEATLLSVPLSVRFTPSAYDFTFGDGATATTSSGGGTWASLGQAQFTPTDTSHAYRERGSYLAQVDVRYTAEVDFGAGWFPITGEVTSTGTPQEVRIFEAHTALVAHTCAQAPGSPGC